MQKREKKKKEKKLRRHTPNSWDATNHTRVTRGAGSQTRLQPVQQDSWLLYSPHTPPTHLFYYPSACSAAHTPTQTGAHMRTHTSEGPAGQRLMTENSWREGRRMPASPADTVLLEAEKYLFFFCFLGKVNICMFKLAERGLTHAADICSGNATI